MPNVRVVSNLNVISRLAEVCQGLESDLAAGRRGDELVPLFQDKLVVVARFIEIRSCGGSITLVLVVRGTDSMTKLSKRSTDTRSRSTVNGP